MQSAGLLKKEETAAQQEVRGRTCSMFRMLSRADGARCRGLKTDPN